MTTNLRKNIFVIFCFTENHKIAEGENSEDFYFDTLITSPPTDLKCESSSSNSLKVTWDDPAQGMEGLENYAFNYRFDKGKRNVHHSLRLMTSKRWGIFPIILLLLISETKTCCSVVEVKYTKKNSAYQLNDNKERFTEYKMYSEIVNGRSLYVSKDKKYGIWWCGAQWRIGPKSKKGQCYGFISSINEECPENVGYSWKYQDDKGKWKDAGEGLVLECTEKSGKYFHFISLKYKILNFLCKVLKP